MLLVTSDGRVFPTEQHIHEDCTRGRSCHTKVFTWFMLVGNEWWPPAPGSLLNPVQRQRRAVFHYGVTLFCSNCSKQFERKWFNCRAPEFKHLMTDLMLIFNEVVGLHLHQWKWKHLSSFIWEALVPSKTEITAVVTDLDTVVSITRLTGRGWTCEQSSSGCCLCRIAATVTKILPQLNEMLERFVLLSVRKLPEFLLRLGFIQSLASSVFPSDWEAWIIVGNLHLLGGRQHR